MSFTLRDGIVIVAVIAGLLLLMAAVRYLSGRAGLSSELQRKVIHVATGLSALSFPLLFSNPLPVFVLVGVSLAVMLVLRTGALTGLGGVLHGVKRESYGEIYLALAIAFTFARAGGEPILYVLPILVITLSDTASALVGTTYGKRRFAVEDGTKSLEGVAAFFVITWLIAMMALLLLTDADRLNIIVLSFLIAAFCALVEADSWHGLDNLFVPVGGCLLLGQYLDGSPVDLILLAVVFLVFLAAMVSFAGVLGTTKRTGRGYAILLFLVVSLVSLLNAVIPALAISAQLVSRKLKPGTSARPDLDLLAVSAGVAIFWLLAGELAGHSVINLFNLTFAAAAVAFMAMALSGWWRLLLGPIAAGIALLVSWVIGANLPTLAAFTPSPWSTAVAVVLPAVGVLVRPQAFAGHRSAKIFVASLIVPIALYIQGVLA